LSILRSPHGLLVRPNNYTGKLLFSAFFHFIVSLEIRAMLGIT